MLKELKADLAEHILVDSIFSHVLFHTAFIYFYVQSSDSQLFDFPSLDAQSLIPTIILMYVCKETMT
jgi:hypothetical protein